MIEIERPKIEIEEISENGTYGKFVVEGLRHHAGQRAEKSSAFQSARDGCQICKD